MREGEILTRDVTGQHWLRLPVLENEDGDVLYYVEETAAAHTRGWPKLPADLLGEVQWGGGDDITR